MEVGIHKIPLALVSVAFLLLVASLFSVDPSVYLVGRSRFGVVVIRIDDIQDYYLHDSQIRLLRHSVENGYPLSLGIIVKDFGLDSGLVEAVRVSVRAVSEAAVHGWVHEDLSQLTEGQQMMDLLRAKNRLLNTLGVDASVLIPPTYSYSDETLVAMNQAGYEIVSGYIDLNPAGMSDENIMSLPATVELSDKNGDNWTMKNVDDVISELGVSIASNGYAVLVTHPAEFVQSGTFDESVFGRYCEILEIVRSQFGLTTLQGVKPQFLMWNSAQALG
jgi:Polysaccharide deacetylase